MKPDKEILRTAMESLEELADFYKETQPRARVDIGILEDAVTVIDGYVNFSEDEEND